MTISEPKIEKNIPVAEQRRRFTPTRTLRRVLAKMDVGDSFACSLAYLSPVNSAIYYFTIAFPGTRFTLRTITPTRLRVWRLK